MAEDRGSDDVRSAANDCKSEDEGSEDYRKGGYDAVRVGDAFENDGCYMVQSKLGYFLNVIFNILNKVYNYFLYPYFVSVIHLLVGVVYCLVSWAIGLPKRAAIDRELLALLTLVAACHALGHIMSNVSFAAVAVSFTHTIKALEPFFNEAASQFFLGHEIPLSLWLSLATAVIELAKLDRTDRR